MQIIDEFMQQLTVSMKEADEAHQIYAQARTQLAQVKSEKYEISENAQGEEIYIPLEVLMEELKSQEVESGRFVSQINGRSTKEERAAELETYMRRNVIEYHKYETQLQTQAMKETMAAAAVAVAENNYNRLHTKIMALRGQIEFLKEDASVEAARLEVQAQKAKSARINKEFDMAKMQLEISRNTLETARLNHYIGKEIAEIEAHAENELKEYRKVVQPFIEFIKQYDIQ